MDTSAAKTTLRSLRALKGKRPIVAVTAYDALVARLADEAGIDLVLVGDSVGNTVLGFDTTVPVTLDIMVHHTAAVARARPRAFLLADVPFAWAHRSTEVLLDGAARLIQEAGADAVKIEGGASIAQKLAVLIEAGIPVMGHIGLQPQQVQTLGGYRSFGKSEQEADRLKADAKALEDAGVFAVLMEAIEANTARQITESLSVPTIGIGAGSGCDGQVLVWTDLLGLNPGKPPSFVKVFADVKSPMVDGLRAYTEAVREGRFPG